MAPVNPDANEVNNALAELFPLAFRKKAYAVFILIGFLLFVVVTVLTVMEETLPMWLKAVSAAWNLVSSFGFAVSRANAGKAGLT